MQSHYDYSYRSDSLQSAFIVCFLNGIFAVLVCFTLHVSVSKKGWNSLFRPTIGSMLAMYVLAAIHIAEAWERIRYSFIDKGQTMYTISMTLSEGKLSLFELGDISFNVNMAIADGVLIWRCWVIWNRSWTVVFLPVLLLAAELASGLFTIAADFSTPDTFPDMSPGSMYTIMSLTYFAASLASTLLTTVLIIFRIFQTTVSTKFRAVAEMVIESSAFYSIALIFLIGFTLSPKFFDPIPREILSQVMGLAPTLMIVRVTAGLARPDSYWSDPALTGPLRFRSRVRSYTTDEGVYTGEISNPGHIVTQKRTVDEGDIVS